MPEKGYDSWRNYIPIQQLTTTRIIDDEEIIRDKPRAKSVGEGP